MNEIPEPNLTLDAELVAYLDGELDAAAKQRLEKRLSSDSDLRRRLQQHRRAWDLLDELPHPEVNARFASTTVQMIAVSATGDVENAKRHATLRQKVTWGIGCCLAVVAAIIGYALTAAVVSTPNRQLVEDLLVIENLDAFRVAEEIEFLRALEREGLFSVEVDDVP